MGQNNLGAIQHTPLLLCCTLAELHVIVKVSEDCALDEVTVMDGEKLFIYNKPTFLSIKLHIRFETELPIHTMYVHFLNTAIYSC